MKINRFLRVIRQDVYLNRSKIIWGSCAFIALTVLHGLFSISSPSTSIRLYRMILFVGGILLTSTLFRDIHHRKQAYQLFMLPASLTEKFLSRLILSTIGYALGLLSIYTITLWLINLLALLLGQYDVTFFNPWCYRIGQSIWQYIVAQSIFFLGAIYFKRYPLIKTILSICIISLLLLCLSGLLSWMAIPLSSLAHLMAESNFSVAQVFSTLHIGHLFVSFLVAALCWITAYYRFKECEDR